MNKVKELNQKKIMKFDIKQIRIKSRFLMFTEDRKVDTIIYLFGYWIVDQWLQFGFDDSKKKWNTRINTASSYQSFVQITAHIEVTRVLSSHSICSRLSRDISFLLRKLMGDLVIFITIHTILLWFESTAEQQTAENKPCTTKAWLLLIFRLNVKFGALFFYIFCSCP